MPQDLHARNPGLLAQPSRHAAYLNIMNHALPLCYYGYRANLILI